jgi:hypothetical protein
MIVFPAAKIQMYIGCRKGTVTFFICSLTVIKAKEKEIFSSNATLIYFFIIYYLENFARFPICMTIQTFMALNH